METNVSTDIFTQHPIAWGIFVLVIAVLAYAMRAIKNEKDVFVDNPTKIKFGPYILLTPGWWSITEQTENFIKFERTDTRYDWFATFEIRKLSNGDVIEDFKNLIKERQLLFDEDAGVIHEDQSTKQGALVNCEVARVEGTATQHGTERVYYDAILAKDHEFEIELWAQSKSSVLNGLVEGPYFEYVIQNIERK